MTTTLSGRRRGTPAVRLDGKVSAQPILGDKNEGGVSHCAHRRQVYAKAVRVVDEGNALMVGSYVQVGGKAPDRGVVRVCHSTEVVVAAKKSGEPAVLVEWGKRADDVAGFGDPTTPTYVRGKVVALQVGKARQVVVDEGGVKLNAPRLLWPATVTHPQLGQEPDGKDAAKGDPFVDYAQDVKGMKSPRGGNRVSRAGDALAKGSKGRGGHYLLRGGHGDGSDGNVALHDELSDEEWGALQRGLYLSNARKVPDKNAKDGGFLYVVKGSVKWRNQRGTVTSMSASDQVCPNCTQDFVLQWQNGSRSFAVCVPCMIKALAPRGSSAHDSCVLDDAGA